MGTKGRTSYRITDQNAIHFLTFSTVGWVDVFTRRVYKDILVDSLRYCQKEKGLQIYSWVIMTNHIHLVASAEEGYELSNILRDFKKYTSRKIIAALQEEPESRREWLLKLLAEAGQENRKNKTNQLWRNDNHPIELYSNAVIDQKVDYIHQNPVEEGIVVNAEDYLYSSACTPGLLEILPL